MKRRWVWQSLTQDGSQTRKVKAKKSLPAGKTGEQGSLPRAERTIERAYVVWKQIKERERERAREYLLRPPFPRQNHGIGAGFRFPPRARRRKLELENCSEPSFPRHVYAYVWKWRLTGIPNLPCVWHKDGGVLCSFATRRQSLCRDGFALLLSNYCPRVCDINMRTTPLTITSWVVFSAEWLIEICGEWTLLHMEISTRTLQMENICTMFVECLAWSTTVANGQTLLKGGQHGYTHRRWQ